MKRCLFFGGLIGLLFACDMPHSDVPHDEKANLRALPQVIDFNFHVKPILSDKCFVCHGPDENSREAGLALHGRELALAALGEQGDRHAIVPGHPEKSELVKRINDSNAATVMPPSESNLVLTDVEKAILEAWIDQGAEYSQHWSFIAPEQPVVPAAGGDWANNAIDHFVAQKHIEHGLSPSPRTSKASLLRRASFTLTGLPPSLEDLDRFLANTAPDAFEAELDRMLASPAYAERMATIWMDLARYGDSHGYQDDPERHMWPWRDWVIHAYAQNMPYNDFVTWQLAGDLLPEASLEQVVATGFNRNHKITYEGGSLDEEFRTEYVADRTQVVGTGMLGLTVECARCHDHKYDPISQQNFFELFAFFNNLDEQGFIEPIGRTPDPYITLTQAEIQEALSFVHLPDSVAQVELMVMAEMPEPRQAHILDRGQYDAPTTPVFPGTPQDVLAFGERPKNRLGLADWLFDPKHPLTARVAVNRLWQQVFGEGIVATSYDFGNQGSLPSHPELLDYLALRYQELGWDSQAILKEMLLSATFQQSAKATPEMRTKDPENRLLARATRIRLEAEMIRDNALFISGLLSGKVGGPSVKPYQPAGIWAEKIGGGGDLRVYTQGSGSQLYRRSLYTFWKRTVPPPSMLTFDAATKDVCTVKRQATNTPMQALIMLNDPQILEASRVLAEQALQITDQDKVLAQLFRSVTSREATAEELDLLSNQLLEAKDSFEANPSACQAFLKVGDSTVNTKLDPALLAAYMLVTNTLFNLDEALNRG